jgi:diacylglycerol kinase (ATP)
MLLILNRDAGSADPDSAAAVGATLAEREPVTTVTVADGTAAEPVLAGHDDRDVVVAGGDGSLQPVLAALYHRDELGARRIGLVPLGTGNDFAHGSGIPLDPAAAAAVVRDGTTMPADLIVDDTGDVVVNAAHAGVGADAADSARPLKPHVGPAAFPIGAFLAGLVRPGHRLTVVVDGRTLTHPRHRSLMVAVSNAPTIAGGTALLSPDASVRDGAMHVTVSQATGPLARIGYALRLRRGRHVDSMDVIHGPAEKVTVIGEPFRVNADGEVSGPVTHRSWRVLRGAWQLFTPAGGGTAAAPDRTAAAER